MVDPPTPSHDSSQGRVHRILVVDDHPIVREGLSALIAREPDMIVSGEAGDPASAWTAMEIDPPDILVLDLVLPAGGGLEFLRKVRREWPLLPVLVVTMHGDAFHAERSLQAGANGFVSKADATRKLVKAIRAVLAGDLFLSGEMAKQIIAARIKGDRTLEEKESPTDILTPRELEVFEKVGLGRSSRDIAAELGVSQKTIESHKENIKAKLSLPDASALAHSAVRWVATGQTP